MIRFIKKWWLLERLRKEILNQSVRLSLEELKAGKGVLLDSHFFIAGRKDIPEHPGLAEKSWWWKWKYKPDKLKKRIHEYTDIFNICVKEGYIEMKKTEKGFEMPSTATPKADSISGLLGLSQELLKNYLYAWSFVLIPLLFGIYGSPYFKHILKLGIGFIKIKLNL